VVLPADIIVVVDNSDSMTDEAGYVQASMNDFVAALVGSGIDANVVMISANSNDTQGVCVPAPLGSGTCPSDQNLPRYRHVVHSVSSGGALNDILNTYEDWKGSLRPDASRTLLVISDDNSSLAADDFSEALVDLDPSFEGFRFSAIVAPYDLDQTVCLPCSISPPCTACDSCCGIDSFLGLACTALPANEGVDYKDLVNESGGVLGNLCTQDFAPAFQDVATAVIGESLLACSYVIPEPPGGGEVNFGQVNVEVTPDAVSAPQMIHQVADEAACGPSGGWYYAPPQDPEHVVFCPITCDIAQASVEASVSVKFGCSTVTL